MRHVETRRRNAYLALTTRFSQEFLVTRQTQNLGQMRVTRVPTSLFIRLRGLSSQSAKEFACFHESAKAEGREP